MSALVPIAMFGWIPAVIGIFAVCESRRAVIIAFLAAWLFLPIASYSIAGFPDYTKMTATCFGVVMATLLFDPSVVFRFRPSWIDIPMCIWCCVPLATSTTVGLGLYDGLSISFHHLVAWGLPYLIGRLYFGSQFGLEDLVKAFFIGGLVYVPLCLFESRMSPQLHQMVYGYHQHVFSQTIRYGGFRPTVFMEHGLMVAVWMCSSFLCGIWLWRSGCLKKLGGIPVWIWLIPLGITVILTRSTGALSLLLISTCLLFLCSELNLRWPAALLFAAPVAWMVARSLGWTPQPLLYVAALLGEDRLGSLTTRLGQEDEVIGSALETWLFGSGTWHPSGLDQLWLLTLRYHGCVGVIGMFGALLLPFALLLLRTIPSQWKYPSVAPAAVLAFCVMIYVLDGLFNGMVNPIFTMATGGLCGALAGRKLVSISKHTASRPNTIPSLYLVGRRF